MGSGPGLREDEDRGYVMKFGGAWRGRLCAFLVLMLTACTGGEGLPPATGASSGPVPDYVIGPLDQLDIFVWHQPELTQNVPVRPDGRISVPLIEDLQAAGKTPTELARDIEKALQRFVQGPVVTVIVTSFTGPYTTQIRVIGEAAHPQAIAYRANMTLLDVMIAVGGLTQYAAGNRATIVRDVGGKVESFKVNITDLIQGGDISANVKMLPGDVLIIPESWF
jgi:polysaccharide biosynthesis/export protein